MERERVLQYEANNDGQSIFLFYDRMTGVYTAFGLSAYYVSMVTEPYMSYSEEMEMPVALLRKEHVYSVRQTVKRIEHIPQNFYYFQMRLCIGRDGYDSWAAKVIEKHSKV